MASLVFIFPWGERVVGILTQPPGAALILRELLGEILGGKALVKYQVSCLLFIMLCFHVLARFLWFPVGLVLHPAGHYIRWVESGWMLQDPTRRGC